MSRPPYPYRTWAAWAAAHSSPPTRGLGRTPPRLTLRGRPRLPAQYARAFGYGTTGWYVTVPSAWEAGNEGGHPLVILDGRDMLARYPTPEARAAHVVAGPFSSVDAAESWARSADNLARAFFVAPGMVPYRAAALEQEAQAVIEDSELVIGGGFIPPATWGEVMADLAAAYILQRAEGASPESPSADFWYTLIAGAISAASPTDWQDAEEAWNTQWRALFEMEFPLHGLGPT